MAKAKSLEDAQASQTEAKEKLAAAKKALKEYYSKNKLKKGKDYSEDKKHGDKVTRLEKNIEKAESVFNKAKEEAKSLKPTTERKTKYDYPADIDTAEKRKKYRQEQRALANGKTKKSKKEKPAKEEKAKSSKKSKKSKEEAPAEEVATKKTKKSKGKKSKGKKSKKSSDD